MAILNFQKPDKVVMIQSDAFQGEFEFRPLEPGYGITIGNSLRRILLSSLEGYAIASIRIEGVDHEFSTIKGVVEDVVDVVLNMKQVRFKKKAGASDYEKVFVSVKGKDAFTAGDISNFCAAFEVLNPDHVICHIDPAITFEIELHIQRGRGYVPAEENQMADAGIGVIAIDSIFTPIKNVKYTIENTRVEQKTDYERLLLEIITDGSIHPEEALKEAAGILIHHFLLFSDENITFETKPKDNHLEVDENLLHTRKILKTPLADLDLSVRAYNCLKAAEIKSLADLVKYDIADLLKFRNFGKKSLTELEELVEGKGLQFGMNVSKYKLDRD
jgi:DNA-directed RNA polymerase subunit alpha